MRIHADDIDDLGPMGIVNRIIERIGLGSASQFRAGCG
jgi:agmatinase